MSEKEGDDNRVPLDLFDAKSNKELTLYVTEEQYNTAVSDVTFATNLLNDHLTGLGCKPVNEFFELKLMDTSNNQSYVLYVDKKTFDKAIKNPNFSAALLEQHQNALSQQLTNTLSTSMDKSEASSSAHSANSGSQVLTVDSENKHDFKEPGASLKGKIVKVKESGCEDNANNKQDENDGSMCNKILRNKHIWTDTETLLLLSLYKNYDDSVSTGKLTYRKLWNNISAKMRLKGYEFSPNQISSKMDSLKRAYKTIKEHNAQSGNSPKKCDYYEQLDDLFSKKPWITPLSTAGSSVPMTDFDKSKAASSSKTTKVSLAEHKIEYLQKSIKDKELKRQALEEYRNKKLSIMEKFFNSRT